jgi:hypothetical protein
MARCTVWPPSFKRWFDKRFGDLCDEHDKHYMLRYRSKFYADNLLVRGIYKRGYKALAIATWLFCQTVGWWYWIRK